MPHAFGNLGRINAFTDEQRGVAMAQVVDACPLRRARLELPIAEVALCRLE